MGEGANYTTHDQRPWVIKRAQIVMIHFLIIQLPSLPGWGEVRGGEETTWPAGRITTRPPSFPLVCGSVPRFACVFKSNMFSFIIIIIIIIFWSAWLKKERKRGEVTRPFNHVIRRPLPPHWFVVPLPGRAGCDGRWNWKPQNTRWSNMDRFLIEGNVLIRIEPRCRCKKYWQP